MAVIVHQAEVVDVYDETGSNRIKVSIPSLDGSTSKEDLPYCFPLLPKSFQSIPKEGEMVFVFLANTKQKESQRFYIGPVISQPQFNENSQFNFGRGNATRALNSSMIEPERSIETVPETIGAFPSKEDLAIVGRQGQDIIMDNDTGKTDENLMLRCGVRKYPSEKFNKEEDINSLSKIIYNSEDPALVQMKYDNTGIIDGKSYRYEYDKRVKEPTGINPKSMINIAAESINIFGVNDQKLNVRNEDLPESKNTLDVVRREKLQELSKELHQLPKGDLLMEYLYLMEQAILNHKHAWNQVPCDRTTYEVSNMINYNKKTEILSDYVRIS